MKSPVNDPIFVIPACPESFPPQRKDSGQAGMTPGFYFFNYYTFYSQVLGITPPLRNFKI